MRRDRCSIDFPGNEPCSPTVSPYFYRQMNRVLAIGCVALTAASCAHTNNRTAVEHEMEALRLRAHAEQAEAVVATAETTRPMPSATESVADPGTPLTGYAQGRYAVDVDGARRHEDEARKIREAAGLLCRGVPPSARTSCPLPLEGARFEKLPSGLRIVPAQGIAGESLRAQIDCALASARVDHPADEASCPLYVHGVSARVFDRPSGPVIDLITDDTIQAEEVHRRAARLARPPPAAAP